MYDNADASSLVNFTYAYAGHGWARASISDGITTYDMAPSYVMPTDPLFALLHAMVEILRYGGEASFTWFYEPATDRWTLHRDGDSVRISIHQISQYFTRLDWPAEGGELIFTAICDIWRFAAKVRLAVSRMAPPTEENHYNPSWVLQTVEYRALCTLVEEHKHSVRPLSGRRKK